MSLVTTIVHQYFKYIPDTKNKRANQSVRQLRASHSPVARCARARGRSFAGFECGISLFRALFFYLPVNLSMEFGCDIFFWWNSKVVLFAWGAGSFCIQDLCVNLSLRYESFLFLSWLLVLSCYGDAL